MWFVVGVMLVAPIVWALAGAPGIPAGVDLAAQYLPLREVPAPVDETVLVAGLAVGALLGVGRARVATTHLSTVAHEFGHGLTAALLGGRVDRLRMHLDGSGVAHTALPGHRPVRAFAVAAVGYLSPGLLALASIQAARAGFGTIWLAYLALVLAVMLLLAVRSWWGAFLTVGLAAAGWAVIVLAPDPVVGAVVAGVAGTLAGGGLVDAVGQWRSRHSARDTDARTMARQTRLPVGLFAGLHLLAAAGLAVATVAVSLPPRPL